MRCDTRHRLQVALIGLVLVAARTRAGGDITADSADDVCAPTTNPCEVTTTVNVVDGSTLDFGGRDLVVKGSYGKLSIGPGSAEIRCGNFTTNSWSYGRVDVKGPVPGQQGSVGGSVLIVARARCSTNALLACATDADCQALGGGDLHAGDRQRGPQWTY